MVRDRNDDEGMTMIPEAIRVKHEILDCLNRCREYLRNYREWKDIDEFADEFAEKFANEVIDLYEMMRYKIADTKKPEKYEELEWLEKSIGDPDEMLKIDMKDWIKYFNLLHMLIHEFKIDVPEMAGEKEETEDWK